MAHNIAVGKILGDAEKLEQEHEADDVAAVVDGGEARGVKKASHQQKALRHRRASLACFLRFFLTPHNKSKDDGKVECIAVVFYRFSLLPDSYGKSFSISY